MKKLTLPASGSDNLSYLNFGAAKFLPQSAGKEISTNGKSTRREHGNSRKVSSVFRKSRVATFGRRDAYENFELTFEYKTSEKCNSGIFFRTDPKNPVQGGFEIQIASDGLYDGKHVVGSLYGAKEPSENAGKPDGEWNAMTLTVNGPIIKVVLNGKTVIDVNIDQWTTANKNPDGTKNKFKTALKDLPRTGHLGFQYHGHPVWFRNVKIKTL